MNKPKRVGAPLGSRNAARGTTWRHAVDKALKQYSKDGVKQGEALFNIANEVVEAALNRDDPNWQFAVKEIGLRLDGKPKEHIDIAVDNANAFTTIGISAAFQTLKEITSKREIIDIENIDQPNKNH